MILNEYTNENMIKNKEILQEQYYGRNKYIDKLDQLFQEIIDIVQKNTTDIKLAKPFSNTLNAIIEMPEITKISNELSDVIKELFNFKEATVVITAFGGLNAFTISSGNLTSLLGFKKMDPYIEDSNGIHFKKKTHSLQCVIGLEMFTLNEVTGRMITAILLHEIGHNFFREYSLFYYMSKIIFATDAINILKRDIKKIKYNMANAETILDFVLIGNTFFDNIKATFTKMINKSKNTKLYPVAVQLISIFTTVKSFIDEANAFISRLQNINIFKNMMNGMNYRIQNFSSIEKIKKIPSNIVGYRNEQFADNFATSYGYGKETVEIQRVFANGNMSLFNSLLKSNAITGSIYDVFKTIDKIIFYGSDVHPESVSRAIDQLNYLKENLNNYDKKTAKKILSDIDECEKALNEFKKSITMAESVKHGRMFSAIYNNIIFATNGDIRYHLQRHIKGLNAGRHDGKYRLQ